MLTRIALVAPSGAAQLKLRTRLSRPLLYMVRDFQNLEAVQNGLSQFAFQVLILRLPAFEVIHAQMLEKLSAAFPHASLITVAQQIHPQARYALRNLSRHTLVDEELEIEDLEHLIARSVKSKSIPLGRHARLHARVRRMGHALLIIRDELGNESKFHARFEDFARMGARLQLECLETNLVPKSRVELHYRSSEDRERIHRIEARVIWCESSNDIVDKILKKKKADVGLRFIAEL